MAEFVVKKWQFGRFLAAKNTGKAAFYVSKAHILRIQSHKQAHYRAQVTRLPRCKNDVTATRV